MKKGILVMMSLALVLALSFSFSDSADARRGGGIKSGKQGFTQTPKKTENVQQSSTGTKSTGATGAAKSGGLFGGSGFMKGMMLGGLAGMLFGGLFGSMGAFGEILGLMVNLLVIVAIFMVIRAAFVYIRNKKPNPDQRRPY